MMIGMSAADSCFFGRQYDHAIAQLRALLDHAPNFFPALFNLGRVLVQKGIYAEAITAFEKAVALSGNREGLPALAHAYALAGKTNEARAILDDLLSNVNGRYVASPMIARILLGLGEIDQCFEWLRKGIEERSTWIVFLKVDPVYDSVRNDPRFTELLRCTGLLGAARAATA